MTVFKAGIKMGMDTSATLPLGGTGFDATDRLAIINVLDSYGYLVDQLRIEEFFDLFCDAPTVEFWHGDHQIAAGWAHFKELTTTRQEFFRREKIQRRHVLTAPRFETQTDTSAGGQVYLQLYKVKDGQITLVTLGYYDFVAVKQRGEWKLQRWIARIDAAHD